jgi:hypothetical protein
MSVGLWYGDGVSQKLTNERIKEERKREEKNPSTSRVLYIGRVVICLITWYFKVSGAS